MKKRVLSLLIALLCLLFAQAQAANTCSHPVDQREPTMVQYSRTVGGVRQLVHGNQCRVCKALVDYGPCTTRPGARPTCTEPVRCVICGGIVIPATGHDFINDAAGGGKSITASAATRKIPAMKGTRRQSIPPCPPPARIRALRRAATAPCATPC